VRLQNPSTWGHVCPLRTPTQTGDTNNGNEAEQTVATQIRTQPCPNSFPASNQNEKLIVPKRSSEWSCACEPLRQCREKDTVPGVADELHWSPSRTEAGLFMPRASGRLLRPTSKRLLNRVGFRPVGAIGTLGKFA